MDYHQNISLYQKRIGSSIDVLANEMRQIIDAIAKNPLITFRVKDPETLRKKMLLKNTQDIFLIDDVYGIRILVESVNEAYEVLLKVSQTFSGYLDHDFIKEPGVRIHEPYKGKLLRLLQFVAYRNGAPFEIQITTVAFNGVNELLHEGYHCRKYQSFDL